MKTLRNIANPLHRAGGYFTPHVLLILLAFIVVYLAGVFTSSAIHYGQTYFERHYVANVPVLQMKAVVAVSPPKALPDKASIKTSYFPHVLNQDGLGACAAFATAETLSFEWRLTHPHSWVILSPRCMYSHYQAMYCGLSDCGSWPNQDAELIPVDGIATYSQVPYPPYQIDPTLPVACANTNYKAPVSFDTLFYGTAAGQPGVDALIQAIAAGYPVLTAIPVYPEFDGATQQPLVVSPQPGETSRGGHEIVAIRIDATKVMPDGTVGAVQIQNSWSRQWGANGRAWLSFDFVRRFVFALQVGHIGTMTAAPYPHLPAVNLAHVARKAA